MTEHRRTGWRVERASDKPLGRTHAGRFFIPLRITTDDQETTEAHLVLTGDDSERLLGELSRLMNEGGPAPVEPIAEQA
ncbi:hypothetical protein ACIPPJ_27740 [Streptomyces sp. NPDC086091]|uniref:hypothetical protein n=1 Tax=Streptomyces sp. NPDC086091 TaxID=3365751 RepID=UPI00381B613D